MPTCNVSEEVEVSPDAVLSLRSFLDVAARTEGHRKDCSSPLRTGAAPILPDALMRFLSEKRCPARKVDLMRFLLLMLATGSAFLLKLHLLIALQESV